MSETRTGAPPRASTEERFKAGERRFSRLEQRLDKSDRDVREHLQKQDGQIADIAMVVSETAAAVALIRENTQSIIETWNEGARAVRFFCRLAQGWRFLLRQVLIPVGLPAIGVYALWHYAHYHTFPNWISDVYKLLVAML
ncbi:hypothetical protein ACVBR5_000943 [Burkholderia cenocepacia]